MSRYRWRRNRALVERLSHGPLPSGIEPITARFYYARDMPTNIGALFGKVRSWWRKATARWPDPWYIDKRISPPLRGRRWIVVRRFAGIPLRSHVFVSPECRPPRHLPKSSGARSRKERNYVGRPTHGRSPQLPSGPSQMKQRTMAPDKKFDTIVIGGGNAALCAAISARREGASVLVLEAAPKFYRGGNTRHTRNMRCAHDAATDILTGPYTEDEFWEDLLRVTGGQTDEELARHMIRESKDILHWIVQQGVRWQPSLGGTLSLGRTNSFFLGGGRAMLNALYLTAEKLGIDILYDAEVIDLDITDGMFLSATFKRGDESATVSASALVAAAGGFEANIEWLKQYWGEVADNFLIRGTP